MKTPLYQEGSEISDVKFPKIMKMVLKSYKPSIAFPYNEKNVPLGRKKDKEVTSSFFGKMIYGKPIPVGKIIDLSIPSDNFNLRTRIYVPSFKSKSLFPTFIFYHGGGYVLGCIEIYDNLCRELCEKLQVVVILSEYRLAPEFKFPSAVIDAWVILKWVSTHIHEYNASSNHIYVIGDSAGGGLSAIIGREASKKGFSQVKGQILLYPWLDQRQTYPSHEKFGENYAITNKYLQFFTDCYQKSEHDLDDPDFSPINAENLSQAVPALIFLASHDPIRDTGLFYHKKLLEHGIKSQSKTYQPTIHGFAQVYHILPRGKRIFDDFIQTIQKCLD